MKKVTTLVALLLAAASIATAGETPTFKTTKLKQDSARNGTTFYSDSSKALYVRTILKDVGAYGFQDDHDNLYFPITADLLSDDHIRELLLLRQKWSVDKALDELHRKKQ